MNRDEALKILNIEEPEKVTDENGDRVDTIEAEEIMKRYDVLLEKNQVDRGGSFYIQSKIFFAKEFLMADFPVDQNKSVWNPPGPGRLEKEEEEAKEDPKAEEKK